MSRRRTPDVARETTRQEDVPRAGPCHSCTCPPGAGDVTAQTRKTIDNIVLCLAAAGATLDDVVKVTVYLKNVDDRRAVNEVRKAYFKNSKPASTLIEISRFALDGMLIEIEAVAVVKS